MFIPTPVQTVTPYAIFTDAAARIQKTVNTILTDRDAITLTAELKTKFAIDLTAAARSPRGITHNQLVWVHALANDSLTAATSAATANKVPATTRPIFKDLYEIAA